MADKEIAPYIDKLSQTFKGNINELEQAIGMWMVARQMGWRVMLLVHDRRTVAKYEKILKIDIRVETDDVGKFAHRSLAWKAMKNVTNFWKAVKGEIPGVRSPTFK